METENLTNYEQTKEKHLENEPIDVITNEEQESPQTNSISEESSESTGYIKNQKSPPHIENGDFSKGDSHKSRLEEYADESEEEVNNHDLGRIEVESDEDCEEEEKLLLSPSHSDEEYDTDEEDDREHLSTDEDTDENENIEKTVKKDNENIDESAYQNNEIVVAEETEETEGVKETIGVKIVENKFTRERAVDDIEKTGNNVGKTRHGIKKPNGRDTFDNGIFNEKDKDHVDGMNVEEVNSLGITSETVTTEREEIVDLPTDMTNPLSTKSEEIEDKEVEYPALSSAEDNENSKQDGDKGISESSETSEEHERETKDDKRRQDMKVKRKTTQYNPTEEQNGFEAKNSHSIKAPAESGTIENAEGEKNLDCPLLKETLTKSGDYDKSEDVKADEDFDATLLCPELSMEVDETPVITENVDNQLTEEEQKLREQTYGEKNPIQYTKIHCTACNVHLGSAFDGKGNRLVHPILKVLICKKCYHFYTSGEFEKDEDGNELYCRWCGQKGQVMYCANCEMVFCKKCIRINFGRKKIAAIRDSDGWLCFRCNPSQLIRLRIHCSEFMEYAQREMANVSTIENPASYLATDFCQCCIPHKKKATESAASEPKASEPKKKRKKSSNYDSLKDRDTSRPSPPVVSTQSSATVAPAPQNATPPPAAKAGGPQRMDYLQANAAFSMEEPGHTPRAEVVQQGPGLAERPIRMRNNTRRLGSGRKERLYLGRRKRDRQRKESGNHHDTGLTFKESRQRKRKTTVSIVDLDPIQKLEILDTILLKSSSEIDELVKTKFGLVSN